MAALTPPLRRTLALALAVLAAGALAACGSGSDDEGGASTVGSSTGGAASAGGGYGGGAAGETAPKTTGAGAVAGVATSRLSIDAVERSPEQLAWSRGALTAKAGEVTIALSNPAGNQLPHAVEVEGGGVEEESQTVQPGDATSVTAQLGPGRYTFYCPVGDHRELGMEGTLTVR